MNLDFVNSALSLISTTAFVVTGLFVGLQLRSATMAQRASSAWQAEYSWARFNVDVATNPETADLLDLIFSPRLDPEYETSKTYRQAHYLIRAMLQISQSQYFLFREGSLPKENWDQ